MTPTPPLRVGAGQARDDADAVSAADLPPDGDEVEAAELARRDADRAASFANLADDLWTRPYDFEFFQAVRLLEQMLPGRTAVGGFGNPADEAVRFGVYPSLGFPASEVQLVREEEDAPVRMVVNFLGLVGPSGVLPHHYTQLVGDRSRVRDRAMRDFFDLFHHRIISLFYKAWLKYRFAPSYERDRNNPLTRHLLDLLGLGTGGLQDRLPLDDESLLYYAGLLSMRSRPALALEQLLADYFAVPVEVEQFCGGWYRIDAATQCALGEDAGASGQLGLGAVAGDEIWDQQAKVRIRLGPLTRAQYDRFLPAGPAYPALEALAHFYGGGEFDFEVQLVLARDEVRGLVLGAEDAAPALGWGTWLATKPPERDPEETVLTL